MSKRAKYTPEEKYEILMNQVNGFESIQEISAKYKISTSTFHEWRYNYEKHGIDGLKESKRYKKYSNELKEQALQDYFSGKYSQIEIAKRYELTNR